jgi:hypothetical protein
LSDSGLSGRAIAPFGSIYRARCSARRGASAGGIDRWTTRLLIKPVALNRWCAYRACWEKWLQATWFGSKKASCDGDFVANLKDVVGLNFNSPQDAVVISMDEKCGG